LPQFALRPATIAQIPAPVCLVFNISLSTLHSSLTSRNKWHAVCHALSRCIYIMCRTYIERTFRGLSSRHTHCARKSAMPLPFFASTVSLMWHTLSQQLPVSIRCRLEMSTRLRSAVPVCLYDMPFVSQTLCCKTTCLKGQELAACGAMTFGLQLDQGRPVGPTTQHPPTVSDGCWLSDYVILGRIGKRRYDRKQSGYGGQTKPVFHKKVDLTHES
jgi:hypothetical protein